MIGFLRSADRPAGWPLARLLRDIRLELEGRIVALDEGDPRRPRALQLAGQLLVAEGLAEADAGRLELVAGGTDRRLAR
jgi:hypothetical protein